MRGIQHKHPFLKQSKLSASYDEGLGAGKISLLTHDLSLKNMDILRPEKGLLLCESGPGGLWFVFFFWFERSDTDCRDSFDWPTAESCTPKFFFLHSFLPSEPELSVLMSWLLRLCFGPNGFEKTSADEFFHLDQLGHKDDKVSVSEEFELKSTAADYKCTPSSINPTTNASEPLRVPSPDEERQALVVNPSLIAGTRCGTRGT